MTEPFTDLPALDAIGRQIVAAARATEQPAPTRRLRTPIRSLVIAALLAIAVAGTAAGGTLLVLRGAVIPAPSAEDVPPEQTPVPDSVTVAPQRSPDPENGPPWGLRLARSKTGFLCSTVGQVVGGKFGLAGMDGRFRVMDTGIVDSCGQSRKNASSLVGARVFDARDRRAITTVVSGVGGANLRSVAIRVGDTVRHRPKVGSNGVFVLALRGLPEDLGIQVDLRFADGHVEHHPFGVSPFVVPDVDGGPAWRVELFSLGTPVPRGCSAARSASKECRPDPNTPAKLCARFAPAREVRNPPASAGVCGEFKNARTRQGYFFAVRRQEPGQSSVPGDLFAARWKDTPARTSVYGMAGTNVKRIDVQGPDGTKTARILGHRGFLVLFGPRVQPSQLIIHVTTTDGRVSIHRGDTNLVEPPQ